jgi:3-phenylpropionate/trans-cinnamate dioxygenase ferredoxin subunit
LARCLVARVNEMPPDSMRSVVCDGVEICLAHTETDEFYAINDICTHEEFNLCEGELWGYDVECPQHGSRFDLRDGHVTGLPAVIPAKTYPVTVEDGDVYVEV